MKWKKLLSENRFHDDDETIMTFGSISSPMEHGHQKDSDRILFSSAFRRMQGKTQVHMFPETDYVRTRLTHTLEVSSVGKILTWSILNDKRRERRINTILSEAGLQKPDLVEAVNSACFAHDIGNAPFGHIGEFAIRSWFRDKLAAQSGWEHLQEVCEKEAERYDFEFFDGNAQGFRVITRLQGWKDKGGLQLSQLTLGAFTKYPFGSKFVKRTGGKFGFFQSEAKYFEKVANHLGLIEYFDKDVGVGYARHPLSFIMEAADDIAYLATDIEDAVKRKMIPFKDGQEILYNISRSVESFNTNRYNSLERGSQDEIKFLRSAAMNALIDQCRDVFIVNFDDIEAGKYGFKDLIDGSEKARQSRETISAMCQKLVYVDQKKIRKEAGAYEIVRTLMELFGEMIEDLLKRGRDDMNDRNKNLYNIITRGKNRDDITDAYGAYRFLVDFVSGMTDKYAAELSHDIRGRRLG